MLQNFPQFSLVAIATFVSVVASASANQFVVYLPTVEPSRVSQVKSIAPDAFYSQLDSGQRVLQVGRYNNLAIAQKRVQEFRQAGFIAEIRSVPPRTASLPAPAVPIPVETAPPTLPPPPLAGVPPALCLGYPLPRSRCPVPPPSLSLSVTYPLRPL
jgi:hypothetical protein